jgi:polyketide biosynthesis acyl carrier protein
MNPQKILELIAFNIGQIVPLMEDEYVSRDSMLSPLGLDSIGRAQLIEMMLEDLKLDVPRYEFYTAHNLGELADLLAEKLH